MNFFEWCEDKIMGFGREMQDFIAAFQVGSSIRDNRKKLSLAEEEEKNRSAEATARAQAQQDQFNATQEGINTRHGISTGLSREKFDYQQKNDADVAARGASKEADDAWYKQIEADPQSGYGPNGEMIPPPSQRGAPVEAIPTGPQQQTGAAPAAVDDTVINYPTVDKAIDGGLKVLSERSGGKKGIQDGMASPDAKAIMEGDGALKPETVKQIDAIIDPDGLLPEEKLSLGRLEATYEFYTGGSYKGKDGVERANEAAAQYIQYARGVAAIHAHAAQVKLKAGDVPGAAKQLVEMHKSIPDGQSTTFDEATMTFETTDDRTGDIIQRGEVTPELIDQVASSFTKGPEFFNVMMQAAQRSKNFNPSAGDKPAKAEKPITSKELEETDPLADKEADAELKVAVDTELFNLGSKGLTDIDGKPIFANMEEFVAQVGPESTDALSDLGIMIAKSNKGVSAEEAAKFAFLIANPDDKVGSIEDQQFDFDVLPISVENKKAGIDVLEIRIGGRTLKLPMAQGTDAITTANRGLFIAAQENTQSKVNMTNERATASNKAYQLDAAEQKRLEEERRAGVRTGRGSAIAAPPLPVSPTKRTGRGLGGW
jgi:hypothetical protein